MIQIFEPSLNPKNGFDYPFYNSYFLVEYYLESSTNLKEAAWALAVGQSVGNPHNRAEFETDELFREHSCFILEDPSELEKKKEGHVLIAFPEKNINFKTDGISSLLVQIMGGQCDIDIITKCVVKALRITPGMRECLKGPAFGMGTMKYLCGISNDQVLLGGVVKPKIGLSPSKYFDLVKLYIDNGCNFIKEDEILSNQGFCPLEDRVSLIANYIRDTNSKVFYCVSLQADPPYLLNYARRVHELGGNGVHVNFHCGMGAYKAIRDLNLPLLIHFQKSGDKILNCKSHNYSIDQSVLFELAAASGCDTLHAGMIGGYMDNDTEELKGIITRINRNHAIPALSCGMHPGLVDYIKSIIGHANWMASVGGAITSHPMGTAAGVRAMLQATTGNHGKEYAAAVEKWGQK